MTKREFLNYCIDKDGPQILINNYSDLRKVVNIAKKFSIIIKDNLDAIGNKSKVKYPFLVNFYANSHFTEKRSSDYNKYLLNEEWIEKNKERDYSSYTYFYTISKLCLPHSKLDENFLEIFEKDNIEENIDIKNKVLNYKKTLLK